MLYDTPCAGDSARVCYTHVDEETKVSIHALRVLLGLIT